MEQLNYKEQYKRLFSAYRSNSLDQDGVDPEMLNTLIGQFPYCQPLYMIYAACLKNNPEKFESQLFKAALRTSQRDFLYQTINHPEKLMLGANVVSGVKEAGDEIEEEVIIEEEPVESTIDGNYFEFNKSSEGVLETGPLTEQAEESTGFGNANTQNISRYNDDTLPYTFLWWLNKTRKEHNDNYQPYVNFKLDTSRAIKKTAADQLNQQIIENIFHINAPFENPGETIPNTVEFELKRKEDEIIEKFIKQDPHIRPMPAEKIDNENKARKSSEDSYDLVSETLAQIYSEQMLFHKAIDTYKKLSFKFPEKNAYFADQISELEKRIG